MATSKLNLPTITGNETADVPRDFNALANAIDNKAGAADGLATLGPDGKVPSGQVNVDLEPIEQALATHTADLASQEVGKGADIIGLPDPNALFTATNVGGAMQELFTNVSNGKSLVGGAIADVDPKVVLPTDPTFQELANSISMINTGAALKNVQRGSVTVASNLNIVTVTIDAVDLSKAFIDIENSTSGTDARSVFFIARFIDATTIQFERTSTGTYPDDVISWEVVEFESGVTVQRGETVTSSTSITVSGLGLIPSRTLLIISKRYTDSAFSRAFVRGTVNSNGSITFTRNNTGTALYIGWFAVSFD